MLRGVKHEPQLAVSISTAVARGIGSLAAAQTCCGHWGIPPPYLWTLGGQQRCSFSLRREEESAAEARFDCYRVCGAWLTASVA